MLGTGGKFKKACVFRLYCVPYASEIKMFLFSGYRKGTSHMTILGPVSGEKGSGQVG